MTTALVKHVAVLPQIETAAAVTLPVPQATEDDPMVGASINGRVHPGGRPCTWHVEYGATSSYGSSTTPRDLPGKLTAHYLESFTGGAHGYRGGLDTLQLSYQSSEGGFIRKAAEGAEGIDDNHASGIGLLQLPVYFYCGWFVNGSPQYLGGGLPDFRGAQFSMRLRGNSFAAHGALLSTWVQLARYPDQTIPFDRAIANWANTGNNHAAAAELGGWQTLTWTLRNRMADWTYGGRFDAQDSHYWYKELDASLAAINIDIFPVQLIDVDADALPTGTLDFDDLEITYRNANLLAHSNGGRLISEPAGGTSATLLVDGWRNGPDHEWESAANPVGPLEFEWLFPDPITLYTVMLHNSTTFPSQTVRVLVSSNNGATYTSLGDRTLPQTSADGPNFLFDRQVATDDPDHGKFKPLHTAPINRLKVRISAGYQSEAWGLGTVEVFGTGALIETDDDWYDVNQDIELTPGTYHYRIVATTADGSAYGTDHTVVVP